MVLKNDGQNAQSEDNGKTFQAGGDLSLTEVHNHNGMSQSDVILLVNELVSSKVSQYAAEAKLEFEKRISSFTTDFYLKMVGQQTDNLLNRFREPSIQTSYRTAAIQYGMCGNDHKKDLLIDLLRDRFSKEDMSMDSIALDEAAANIGKITNNQLNLLTFWAAFTLFIPLTNPASFDELKFYIEECSRLIPLDNENLQYDISFLISAGYIQYQRTDGADICIRIIKMHNWEYHKEFLSSVGINWDHKELVEQKSEPDLEKRLFPNFIRACEQIRQNKAATTRVSPSGTMLAMKNITLKIPEFPEVFKRFYD